MRSRWAHLLSAALVLFLLGQPLMLLALDQGATAASCCQGKCCCRRAHQAHNTPAWEATPTCACPYQTLVRHSSAPNAMTPPAAAAMAFVASLVRAAKPPLIARNLTERALDQRPPPDAS